MQIQTNTASLFAQRSLADNQRGLSASLRRLSSGLRVNSAADDAAGLAIADRIRAQLRGTAQAARNTNDGVSLLQTAEGAMASVGDMLQRIRELAVQAANATNGSGEKKSLQAEVNQLMTEISRIGRETTFNGQQLFSQSTSSLGGDANQRAVLDGLKLGWLQNSEALIKQYYGIEADGQTLTIDLTFTDGPGNTAASVSGNVGPGGKTINMKLNIDMADFTPPNLPNGGSAPVYNDRIIAHEMVHAVMGRATNMAALPTWFLEGSAEFIHGGDERLAGDIGATDIATVVGTLNDGGWGGNSVDYSAAYAGVRYMHERLKSMGTDGIKAVMKYLATNTGSNLDAALNAVSGGVWATSADFVDEFNDAGNGDAFIAKMDLTNDDTGAIGGFDADRGPVRNAEDVINDFGSTYGNDVLTGFAEVFPTIGNGTGTNLFQFQVGADSGQTIDVRTAAVNAAALGIQDIDLISNPTLAIVHIDEAINFLSSQRADLGAAQSRMATALSFLGVSKETNSSSLSRIVDTDFAAETAALTRAQIIQQAGVAMVAQANSQPRLALQLLG